ncbi:MAG: sigma-70 family RNA polymerase sigma factor [Bacteroidales bacterium]|nr:sigma-70 family RNA polymerase sigma factor [Bacteroidales bacterium]
MSISKNTPSITNRDSNAINLYLKDIKKYPILSLEEEEELSRKARSGNMAAREKLINCNLRFVITVAKEFQGLGILLEDLIAEGNKGLITAVDGFDETRGFKLISYGVYWIRQNIRQAIANQCRIVRLPVNKSAEQHKREHDILRKLFGIQTKYSMTAAEVATEFGISRERVEQLKKRGLQRLRKSGNLDHLRSLLAA